MSTCIKCDRCHTVRSIRFDNGLSMTFPGFIDRDIDLCDKCTKEFREFMAAKRRIRKDKK